MSEYTATVGNVQLVSLCDGQMGRKPTDMFPASTMQVWRAEYPELLDSEDLFYLRLGSVAVRSAGKMIIVDTGLHAPDGTLLEEMRQKGVDRESVDIVVMTHLHRDHVGWNLVDGSPTFPKARYLVPSDDWEHWTSPVILKNAPHITDQLVPLDKLRIMDLIEGEHKITDELTTLPTPGHTPGHTSIVISSAGERGFILGDAAHSVAQAHYTDWNPPVDVDQDQSRKTRNEVFDRLEADGSLISAGHFPDQGFGRLIRRDGRRVWHSL